MKVLKTLAAALGLASTVASAQTATPAQEQAVVIHFNYGSLELKPLRDLEDKLDKALSSSGVGDFDGDEIAVSGKDGFLYMYGPSADSVFNVVLPILQSAPFMHGAQVTKVYGKLGSDAPRSETHVP
jgi:hypothetical protein